MSATQTITHDGNATLDAIARRSSPKLTEHASRTPSFPLSPADHERLTRWTRAATSPRRVVTRSLVVLLAASGASNVDIAARLGVTRATVALWKARFLDGGPDALLNDAPGRGRKPGRDPQLVTRVLRASAQRSPHGARSTLRDIARRAGASHASVQRILREHEAASTRPSHVIGVASARAAQASDITSSCGAHVANNAPSRAAQAISETPRTPTARVVVAAALRLTDASPHVIANRHQRDGIRSRRSIFRKATA